MSHYRTGRDFEYHVRDHLRTEGYDVIRSAGSKTKVDLLAFKPMQALVIQCKRTTMPGPAERADLLRVASYLGGIGVPLVALKPLRQGLQYRRLTGPGPREWVEWRPDELGGAA